MRLLGLTGLALGLSSMVTLAVPQTAEACGGTFCDAGPAVMDPEAMPVEQTGETIVFVVDETHVEAHIQIEYDPDSGAERFAWLIPVFGEPEFSVGSQRLFLNLLNSTVPSYGYVNDQESCGGGGGDGWDDWDGDGYDVCGASSGAGYGGDGAPGGTSGGDGGADGTGGETTGGGTEVLQQATIGAFDVVVLQAQTAKQLMVWLDDNDFYQDPLAHPILEEYIEEGAVFAAVRLSNTADVGEIHPIRLRYEGSEPCVPIRLTRIAAKDDMDIRAFFLGSGRVYSTNYRHVELNPIKLDWIDLADNYKEVVTLAIDTPTVDGHGFVTEYAGSTAVIDRDGIYEDEWDYVAFQTAELLDVPGLLKQQGLLVCEDDGPCTDGHALIWGILGTHIPVPEGVDPGDFYACLECYEGLIDTEAWNGYRFARDVQERIIEPGLHAAQLLESHPFVTRLYTTLSPHEMTEDPMFHATSQVDVVDDRAVAATRHFACNGRVRMQGLPGNRTVRIPPSNIASWPDIAPDEMPWVERVTEHVADAAPVVLIDNTALIDELLDLWNANVSQSQTAASCHGPEADGEGRFGNGCGCRSDGGGGHGWALMLLALGLGRLSRRLRA